jgi:hypothetical protein
MMARKSVKVKASELRWEASSWRKKRQFQKWEMFGLRPSMDLDDLVIHYVDDKSKGVKSRVADLNFKEAVTAITIDRTIEGASTITVELLDPNQRIFSDQANRMRESQLPRYKRTPLPVDDGWNPIDLPSLIGRAVELTLDDVVFRLTKVEYVHSTKAITMTFEDRIVYWLRRKYGPKYMSRAKGTRAEFILALLREVKAEKVPFICPELHEKQKIAKAE